MAKRVGAQPKPGLAKYVLALLLVPLVVALQRDHSARAHVHAGSVDPDGHLRQLIEHRSGHLNFFFTTCSTFSEQLAVCR